MERTACLPGECLYVPSAPRRSSVICRTARRGDPLASSVGRVGQEWPTTCLAVPKKNKHRATRTLPYALMPKSQRRFPARIRLYESLISRYLVECLTE